MTIVLILLTLLLSGSPLLADTAKPGDFAAGYYLDIDKEQAVYGVELPEDLYRTVKSADLQDVSVFNSAGELVPHTLRQLQTDPEELRDRLRLALFPLYGEKNNHGASEFSLQVRKDATGAIVSINPVGPEDSKSQTVTGYLLDLGESSQPIRELELYWSNLDDSSVFTITIEQSPDLVHWSPLVYRATLADLRFEGQRVEKRAVRLPRQPLRYLKLSWKETQKALKLAKVFGLSPIKEARRKHRWMSLYTATVEEKDELLTYQYRSRYNLPTSSVQLLFPETNSIARLLVQSRGNDHGEWRKRCEQLFYNVSVAGSAIRNEPCRFPSTPDSLWRLVVREDGAGFQSGNRTPTLQLGWQPSELLFLGRGAPPYLLAFGSGRIAVEKKTPASGMVLQMLREKSASEEVGRVRIGKKIELGGIRALQAPEKPYPWKKWLLWIVLLLGVGVLALMARALFKEIESGKEKEVPGS